MYEILTWGDSAREQWERLGITPQLTHPGDDAFLPATWTISEADLQILMRDSPKLWEKANATWILPDWSGGDLPPGEAAVVNGHEIQGHKPGTFPSLLAYWWDNLLASQPRLVVQRSVDLAGRNGLTIGELYRRYQPVKG